MECHWSNCFERPGSPVETGIRLRWSLRRKGQQLGKSSFNASPYRLDWCQRDKSTRPRVAAELCDVYDPGSRSLTATALDLLSIFGSCDEAIGHILRARLTSFGSFGSRIPYLEERVFAVQKAAKTADQGHVARWLAATEESLLAEIRMEHLREAEEMLKG